MIPSRKSMAACAAALLVLSLASCGGDPDSSGRSQTDVSDDDVSGGTEVKTKASALTNAHSPIGNFEYISQEGRLVGWTCDQDSPLTSIAVHFYTNAPVWSGGSFLTWVTANSHSESAVKTLCGGGDYHRFNKLLTASERSRLTSSTLIYAHAIDPQGPPHPVLPGSPHTFTPPAAPPPPAEASFSPWSVVHDPGGSHYSYAPSAMVDGGTHVFTCYNPTDGVMRDSIYKVGYGVVLSPGTTWDSYHVCDPEVVKGSFAFAGTTYAYAMLYLGTYSAAGTNNQIGIAFSNNLTSWVRYPDPIIRHPQDGSWGVGEPAATMVDPARGTMLVFYTRGELPSTGISPHTYRQYCTFGDMGSWSCGPAMMLSEAGLRTSNGRADFLRNASLAYDGVRNRFWVIREQAPYPTSYPTYISQSLEISWIPASAIWNGGGTWTHVGELWTFDRNHNPGFERNAWGALSNTSRPWIYFSRSCGAEKSSCPVAEWSYAVYKLQMTPP